MTNLFKRFAKDESGATAIEYGLIAAIVAVIIVAVFPIIQGGLNTSFNRISTALSEAPNDLPGN